MFIGSKKYGVCFIIFFIGSVFLVTLISNWELLTAYHNKYNHSEEMVLASKYAIVFVELFFLLHVITGIVWFMNGEFLKKKVTNLFDGEKL